MKHAGRVVFPVLLCLGKVCNAGGRVTEDYLRPGYLADVLDMDKDECSAGLLQVVRVGLCERDGPDLIILNWGKYQPPSTLRKKPVEDDSDAKERKGTERNGKEQTKHPERLEHNGDGDVTKTKKKSETMTFHRLSLSENQHKMEGEAVDAAVNRIFYRWCEKTGQGKKTTLNPSKRRTIKGAMTHSTEDEINCAIDACGSSEFHLTNGHTKLNDHVLKDRDKIEWWCKKWEQRPKEKWELAGAESPEHYRLGDF